MAEENQPILELDYDKIKSSVKNYVLNRGYVEERTIRPHKSAMDGRNDYGIVGFILALDFAGKTAPINKIYREGRKLFEKTFVMTPTYKEWYDAEIEKYEQTIKKFKSVKCEGFFGKLTKKRLLRWVEQKLHPDYMSREFSHIDAQNPEARFSHPPYSMSHFPPMVPEEESKSALIGLYRWLEDNKDEMYKIKNHTSIVTLNQLRDAGLQLDELVFRELKKIPKWCMDESMEQWGCVQGIANPVTAYKEMFNDLLER